MMKEGTSDLFEYDVCVCDRKKYRNNFLSFGENSSNSKVETKSSMISEPVIEDFSNMIEEFND
jgi:hypothetical protein